MKGKNAIPGCFKYIIMFVIMQYYFAYSLKRDQKVHISVCCGTLINKTAVSDETSLISSEVEYMWLISMQIILFTLQVSESRTKSFSTWRVSLFYKYSDDLLIRAPIVRKSR